MNIWVIVGFFVMVFAGLGIIFSLFRKNPINSVVATCDSIECLQQIVLNLDPESDKDKVEFLLNEIAPILINPRRTANVTK